VQYGCTWWYARRVVLQPVLSRWSETWAHFRIFGRVGFAFMWSALLAAVVGLLIRGVIVRDFGLEANGVYQAALTLANMFGAFILSAMSIDYYPRLSAVAWDHPVANRSVNEQIEVGVLLALPGLVGTLAFAGLLMQLFYTKAFLEGAALLPWLCVGVFAKVVLWPVGMISQAKGASRWMVISQTHANVVSLVVSLGMMAVFGLRGVAYAVPLVSIWHGSLSIWIGHRLSGFWFSKAVLKLVGIGFVFIVCAMLLPLLPSALMRCTVGAALTLLAAVVSLRGIARRLGEQHRIVMLVCRLPGGRFICGL